MNCLAHHKSGGVVISIYVQPKSSKNRVGGIHDDALKIYLTAPPVEGKANKAVIGFFSQFLKIPKKNVSLVSGHQSRKKRVLLTNINLEAVRDRVLEKTKE